jgi:hypothetical protein
MTSFVHVDIPANHPGVARVEALIDSVHRNGGRGLAVMLLAIIVSSLLVAADRLMSVSPEGNLLMAWLTLCGAVFAGLALFVGAARSVGRRFARAIEWSRRRSAARKLMDLARLDPRVMRDLQVITSHQETA